MREIKFRAWDCYFKCFTEYYIEKNKNGDVKIFFKAANHFTDYDIDENRDRFKLMQYTGLLDKNGREIYEGDIMVLNKLKPIYYVVKYKENGFVLDGVLLFENAHYFTEREVVGNTFENPELLEN